MTMKDLSALDVPGPTITALSAPFWKAAQEGGLPSSIAKVAGARCSAREATAHIAGAAN
jgi:hypothetical protein